MPALRTGWLAVRCAIRGLAIARAGRVLSDELGEVVQQP